jgi:uncharacterized protein (DUF1684 family)
MSELNDFRKQKDEYYRNDPNSPLTEEQKAAFKGLKYFPENPDLRLTLLLQGTPDDAAIQMETSKGGPRQYVRFGKIRFQAESQPAELTIFSSEFGLFLPFVDSLAGTETYPAGRYLEPVDLGDGRFLVDFNLAYNPYCAYNDRWSCPVTPLENHLKVPIRAGEKVFHD